MLFSVQPSALMSAADSLGTVTVQTAAALQPSMNVAKAHSDWQAAGPLTTCVVNWTNRLRQLATATQDAESLGE